MNFESGRRYSLALATGTVAAALAANSPVFAMKLGPNVGVRARIDRMRVQWTPIVAFTTPITAGRSLEIVKASGGTWGGGTSITDIGKRQGLDAVSQFDDSVTGSAVRIATTAALTFDGVVEPHPMQRIPLTHLGAAGAFGEFLFDFDPNKHNEIVVAPGESLLVRNPVLMDAAGTWQLNVQVDWREVQIQT